MRGVATTQAMGRRIVLVDFNWTRDKDPRVPLGHASLLARLRLQAGLDVRSVVRAANSDSAPDATRIANDILGETGGFDPTKVDVAFGAYVWGEELLQRVLPQLRSAGFRGRIILGGPQISYCGPGLEKIYPDADAFVRGYGEEALAALVATPERQLIPGVHWAGEVDALGQANVDLETLPSPWLTGVIPLAGQGFVRWETQRGCSFRCAFCQHRDPDARPRRRDFSLERLGAEIDLFCRSDVTDIAVLDPVFNMAHHAVCVLRRFAERGFGGRLSLQCRAETMSDEFLDAAAALNVRLEFGLQTIHPNEANAIQRRNQIDRVEAALAKVRSHGIRDYEVSLIFGLPRQTLASFEASVAWGLDRGIPVIKAFPLLLLRGTELERDRKAWGFDVGGGTMPMALQSSSFDIDDWKAMARISEALLCTEGHHPKRLEELKALAATLIPDVFRWIPSGMKQVA